LKVTDFLDSNMVIPSLAARDKPSVLKEMTHWASSQCRSLDEQKVLKVLLEKEKQGSSAIGEGVAVPHGAVPGLGRIQGVFGRSLEGVEFDSIDGRPTYLFFLLIEPESSAAEHLKAMARISRLLKNVTFRDRLLHGSGKEEIFQIIKEEDDKL